VRLSEVDGQWSVFDPRLPFGVYRLAGATNRKEAKAAAARVMKGWSNIDRELKASLRAHRKAGYRG
jgi:hypothetical protein